MIRFILNDSVVQSAAVPGTPLLDIIRRERGLKGTKLACGEGECGACTVLIGELAGTEIVYKSITSCIAAVGNVQGKHVVTVEGLQTQRPGIVQRKMIECNGTQCGFCTPGFVMSLASCLLQAGEVTAEGLVAAADGNICRCTGYKSIERAAQQIANHSGKENIHNHLNQWIENGDIPEYFKTIPERLRNLQDGNELLPAKDVITGGGTDLYVQKPYEMRQSSPDLTQFNKNLQGISIDHDICRIGAGETMSSLRSSTVLQAVIPDIRKYLAPVGSTQIRNMATLGGNLVNASPIGDLTILFLGLDASIFYQHDGKEHGIKLRDFYVGYKKMAKPENALITRIEFDTSGIAGHFHFERVCKRTYLDVASVNSACMLLCNLNNIIETIHLSAGGVSPIPLYLSRTASFLRGQRISSELVQQASAILQSEVAPITDIRGSAAYKGRLLLHQFFLHMTKLSPVPIHLRELLPT